MSNLGPGLPSGVPSPPAIPGVGQAQAQLAAGEKLAQMASSGDAKGLLASGVTLLSGLGSGGQQIAQIATDIFGGASAGFAVGGPYGALAGAAAGAVQALFTLGAFSGAQSLDDGSQTDTLYQRLGQWCAVPPGNGLISGHPQGWSASDYAAVKRPPKTTPRPALLWALLKATGETLQGMGIDVQNFDTGQGPGLIHNVLSDPTTWTPAAVASVVEPLCTPVWWYWGNPSLIVDCIRDEWFGWATPPDQGGPSGTAPAVGSIHDPSTILGSWWADIVAPNDHERTRILQRAIDRLPDPLYFAADLYAVTINNGGINKTFYYNTHLLIGMATVLGLLTAGASTRSICSELLMQARSFVEEGTGTAQLGFQALLDDYLALAHYEEAKKGFPGWGAVRNPAEARAPHAAPAPGQSASAQDQAPPEGATRAQTIATVERYLAKYLAPHR